MTIRKTLVGIALAGLAIQIEAKTVDCKPTNEKEIGALFDGWNAALATLDPNTVVGRYATTSILLPTVSNTPRLTPEARRGYFEMFLKSKPREKLTAGSFKSVVTRRSMPTFTPSRSGMAARFRRATRSPTAGMARNG